MDRPRRKLFGPLFYWTAAIAVIVTIGCQFVIHQSFIQQASQDLSSWLTQRSWIKSLSSPDASERELALKNLVAFGSSEVVPHLLRLAESTNALDRAQACRYLVDTAAGLDVVIPILATAARDSDRAVRSEAAQAFGCLVSRCSGVVFANHLAFVEVKSSHDQIPDHAKRLGSVAHGTLATWAPSLLAKSVEALRVLLADADSDTRVIALASLWALSSGEPAVTNDLEKACSDPDRRVRIVAARALLAINGPDDPTAAKTLIELVASHEPIADRPAIGLALKMAGRSAQGQAVTALASLLTESDLAIHQDVIDCLVSLGEPARAAIPAIKKLLQHADPAQRAIAALAIATIDAAATNFQLPGRMGAPGMMSGAAGGVGMPVTGGTFTRANALELGPEVVDTLLESLEDVSLPNELRMQILEFLIQNGSASTDRASGILIRQLGDPDPEVRAAALGMLGSIVTLQPARMPDPSVPRD
jgi:HEAT repeat protein